MKLLSLLAIAAAVSAVPLHADVDVVKVDSKGVHTFQHFPNIDLDNIHSIDDLVHLLKLDDKDSHELKEEKKSIIDQVKGFENTQDALEYFRDMMTDAFSKVDGYFKPEDEEESKKDKSIPDFSILGKKPHSVQTFEHSEKSANDVEHFKHRGPHSVKTHNKMKSKGCSQGKQESKPFDIINYIKSFTQAIEEPPADGPKDGPHHKGPHHKGPHHKGPHHPDPEEEHCAAGAGILGLFFLGGLVFMIKKAVARRRAAKNSPQLHDEEEKLPLYEEDGKLATEKN